MFCSTTSTLITWWQIYKNFLFHNIPHHVMTGAQEFLFLKGPRVITWWQVHKNFWLNRVRPHCLQLRLYCLQNLTCFTVVKHSWVLEITIWHDVQSTVYEKKYLAKNDDQSQGKRGTMLLMIREESSNWRKNHEPKHKKRIMINGDVVVVYMTGYNVILRMWRWQARNLRNWWYSNNLPIIWMIL
jgi:hypothetical protein